LEKILPLHIREVLLLHDKEVDSINDQHALRVKKLIRNNQHLLFTLDTVKRQFRRQKLCLEKKLKKKKQKITRLRSIIRGQKQLDQEQQASSLVKREIRMDDIV
jgi:hypothetical protein